MMLYDLRPFVDEWNQIQREHRAAMDAVVEKAKLSCALFEQLIREQAKPTPRQECAK
jgi:hypothetical protein